MDYDEIKRQVIAIVAEQFAVDRAEIDRDTGFVADLDADRMDTIELMLAIDEEFSVAIPDDEAHRLQTVGQLLDYIMEQLSEM